MLSAVRRPSLAGHRARRRRRLVLVVVLHRSQVERSTSTEPCWRGLYRHERRLAGEDRSLTLCSGPLERSLVFRRRSARHRERVSPPSLVSSLGICAWPESRRTSRQNRGGPSLVGDFKKRAPVCVHAAVVKTRSLMYGRCSSPTEQISSRGRGWGRIVDKYYHLVTLPVSASELNGAGHGLTASRAPCDAIARRLPTSSPPHS